MITSDTLFRAFYYALALTALALGALLVAMQTSLIPGYEVRIVQSGSMEPAISTGSVVIVKDQSTYTIGDVITFGGERTGSIPTTHRIMEEVIQSGERAFITKGDANESADLELVRESSVRGVVIVSIPFLGYILDFARQPLGFFLLVGVPALIIVVEETSSIVAALRARRRLSTASQTVQVDGALGEEKAVALDGSTMNVTVTGDQSEVIAEHAK